MHTYRSGGNVRDGVHERNVDLDGFRDQVLDFTEHGEVVLGLDVLGVRGVQARDEAAKGSDADTLTDSEDRGIDVGSTSLQGGVSVGNSCNKVVSKEICVGR